MKHPLTLLVMALALAVPTFAHAELTLVEGDTVRVGLGAYVGSVTSYQTLPYETDGVLPDATGSNAALLRFEWKASIGESVAVDVQNRFFWSLGSGGQSPGGLGLGATVAPTRTLDLRTEILRDPGVLLEHDLDRLAVTIFSPFADITVGRQAITWGNSTIFAVGDLWTQFSPFELDTSQKRGVDGLRLLSYPGSLELDLVVIDRGATPTPLTPDPSTELEDLSGGVRLGWSLGDADYYGALAKNYRTLWGLMGISADVGIGRLHAEVGLPLALELENEVPAGLRLPRATVGFDWFESSKFTLFGEYHFNGPGVPEVTHILQLTSPDLLRGERYFLGRHYGGLGAAYLPFDDLLTLSLSAISNLADPSVLLSPSVGYALAQNVTVSLGGYMGLGGYPEIEALPGPGPDDLNVTRGDLKSEYGLYGYVAFLQLAGYF